MIEIGEFQLVDNSFSTNRLMSENTELKNDNAILTYFLVGAAVVGGILLYCYVISQEEKEKGKTPRLVRIHRNPM